MTKQIGIWSVGLKRMSELISRFGHGLPQLKMVISTPKTFQVTLKWARTEVWTLRVILSLQSLEKSRMACSHLFHLCLFSPVGLLSGPGPIPRWTCPHRFLVHNLSLDSFPHSACLRVIATVTSGSRTGSFEALGKTSGCWSSLVCFLFLRMADIRV